MHHKHIINRKVSRQMYTFGKEILLMKVRKEVKEAMEVLGIDQCRRGQLKPIGKILKGKDVLLIAPTGFGKSMVYQIPAVCWWSRWWH